MHRQDGLVRVALVFGHLPSIEELEQFNLITDEVQLSFVSAVSVCEYLGETGLFPGIQFIALPDYDENPSYLPGLDKVLTEFDIVIVKERLGLYAFQAVKAKIKSKFKLAVWTDNLTVLPAEDVAQMRTIRSEVTASADMFFVQSDAAKTTLMMEGVEEARISMLPVFVKNKNIKTMENRTKAAATLGISAEDFVVAFLGQVEWEERLFALCHAIKLASVSDAALKRRLKLVICGVGSFTGQVKERAIKLGIDDRTLFLAPSKDAISTVLAVADCMFYAPIDSRDRLDGDPYRLVLGMANGVPLLAARSAVVEEYVGKHRIDFCPDSVEGLADAMVKASMAKSLLKDIAKKNQDACLQRFSKSKVTEEMVEIIGKLALKPVNIDTASVDYQIIDIESRVKSKQYLAAIEAIETLINLQNLTPHQQSTLYRLIGDCFTKLGDFDSGKEAYSKSLDYDRLSSKAYIGLGTTCLAKSNHDIAVLHFQKAVSLAPNDEMANLGLGLGFQGMAEYKEASRWIARSLEINAVNTAAIFSLVQVCNAMGQFEEAIKALKAYLVLHPQDDNMHYALGGIYYRTGEYTDAKTQIDCILKVDPMDTRAQTLMKQITRATEITGSKTANTNI